MVYECPDPNESTTLEERMEVYTGFREMDWSHGECDATLFNVRMHLSWQVL